MQLFEWIPITHATMNAKIIEVTYGANWTQTNFYSGGDFIKLI